MTSTADPPLPSFLCATEVTELDHLPMQVLLLTMEVAEHRKRIELLSLALHSLAAALRLPSGDPMAFLNE